MQAATLGPSSFEARSRSHLRMTDNKKYSRGASAPEACSTKSNNNKGRRSAERRTIHWPRMHQQTSPMPGAAAGLCGARSPSGASRRRLSQRANAATQPRPCFARPRGCRRYPRRQSHLSGAPRAPVVMPAGTIPGPPGSGVTSPARRNRTRPIHRLSPVDVPEVGEIRYSVPQTGTFVNEKVTVHMRHAASFDAALPSKGSAMRIPLTARRRSLQAFAIRRRRPARMKRRPIERSVIRDSTIQHHHRRCISRRSMRATSEVSERAPRDCLPTFRVQPNHISSNAVAPATISPAGVPFCVC